MSFFSTVRTKVFGSSLTPPPLPKAPNRAVSVPSYRSQVTTSKAALQKPSVQSATLDRVVDAKTQTNDYLALKRLSKNSPELSAAISLKLRTAITERFKIFGRNLDGQVDANVTAMAHELLRRLTFLGSPDGSYGAQQTIQSLSETLGQELMLTGAACLEVALDKQRVPASMNVIAVSTLLMYEEDNNIRLVQKIGGTEISLDLPTIIYTALDQNPTDAYATSPLTASIQAILSDLDFNNDIRKGLKRAVLPRLKATVNSERLKKLAPPEVLADPEKFAEFQNSVIDQVEGTINGLNPEDALVGLDIIDYAYIDGGHDPSTIIERVQKVLNAKVVAGAKTMPVTLGFTSSSSASSAESLLFLKECDAIRRKLNEIYSRALTVAVRLSGLEGYVEFVYDAPDLRPSQELEAYRAMEQSRILQQLSLGFISDEEASIHLTGHLPPPGAPKLSGTLFMSANPTVDSGAAANPSSGTSTMNPKTPTQPKSAKQV
jgi:hypothetical protein